MLHLTAFSVGFVASNDLVTFLFPSFQLAILNRVNRSL